MTSTKGRFGAFLAGKRYEKDACLKPIAERMGISVSYLSDIFNGRRYPPDIEGLEAIAEILNLNEGERNEMFDLAGRERNQVSPDLLEYIMDETLPSLRDALRKAKAQSLGEEFWQEISRIIEGTVKPTP